MNLSQLREHFHELYGHTGDQPRCFFAPGRVNLIGEHTDYNGGFVLPCALQFGTYLLIRPSGNDTIRMASLNQEFSTAIDIRALAKTEPPQWVNYPLGIFDQYRQQGIRLAGFDMLFWGDIPGSAGLSSSASIEMATAYALAVMLNATELEMIDLVKMAQRAENEFVGVNCGIMDMFAIGYGQPGQAVFLNCLTLEYKMAPVEIPGFRLVIANTNKPRGLAGSRYNERVAECQLAVTYLAGRQPISKLGEISFMQFFKMQEAIPDELIRRRARHVISENQRVLNAVSALFRGEILQFGALMNASHESLRDNYEVTGVELDTLVEEAQKINGVVGSRMTGAGFGGCTVSLVREDTVDRFMEEVGNGYRRRTGLEAEFYLGEIGGGVREVSGEW